MSEYNDTEGGFWLPHQIFHRIGSVSFFSFNVLAKRKEKMDLTMASFRQRCRPGQRNEQKLVENVATSRQCVITA